MAKEKFYSGTIPKGVTSALLQIRQACSWPVTKTELDLDAFGKSLRKLREDNGIAQNVMAKAIGVSPAFLSDCELGNRKLPLVAQIKFVKECMKCVK